MFAEGKNSGVRQLSGMAESISAREAARAKALQVEQGVFGDSMAGAEWPRELGVCTGQRRKGGARAVGLASSWQGFGFYSQRPDQWQTQGTQDRELS